MNFYERWILPRLLDLAMRNKEATRFRARLVSASSLSVVGNALRLRAANI